MEYEENQKFHILIYPITLIVLTLIVVDVYDFGSKPIPTFVTVIFTLVLTSVLAIFYKLKVGINKDNINVSFGCGLIKNKISIHEIDTSKINKVDIPWHYGMGLRVVSGYLLYNTKPGVGIAIHTKNKKYIIGTSGFDAFKKVILKNRE